MSEMLISCAGCGKRFKGLPSSKKFKCSGCGNHFTFPDSTRAPAEGSVLCSCCWTSHVRTEELAECSQCGQDILTDQGGLASWSTEGGLIPATVSGHFPSLTTNMSDAFSQFQRERDALVRENAELKLRLQTANDAQAEHTAAMAARLTLEERIIELKTRLAIAAESERDAETRLVDLQSRHVALLDNETSALRERDGAAISRQATELRVTELDAQLKAQLDLHAQYLKDRDNAIECHRLAEARVIELMTRAETGQDSVAVLTKERDEALTARRELESKAATLEAQLAPLQEMLHSARDERDVAMSERQSLESRIAEIQERVIRTQENAAAAQESATLSRLERDRYHDALEQERAQRAEAQTRLKQFQDLAVTALGPLGTEYARVAGELIQQTEALFRLTAQTQDELDNRRVHLKALERSLKGQLDLTCRDFVERLAQESAAPEIHAQNELLPEVSAPEISEHELMTETHVSIPSDNVVPIHSPDLPPSDSEMQTVPESGEHASVAGQ